MLKKEVKYTDFNGKEREETLYFHLSKSEMIKLEVQIPGGFENLSERLDPQNKPDEVVDLFELFLLGSYGEKSEDGKRFVKTPEVTDRFRYSAVYDSIFMSMLYNPDEMVSFFNELVASATGQSELTKLVPTA
jgi:hypothetical protein